MPNRLGKLGKATDPPSLLCDTYLELEFLPFYPKKMAPWVRI
jgi:hypothetical protein